MQVDDPPAPGVEADDVDPDVLLVPTPDAHRDLAGNGHDPLPLVLQSGWHHRHALGRPCRHCGAVLGELIDLLALEHVHDPDREEAARFAMIDPADPVVEQNRWLTDRLREALGAQDAFDIATSTVTRRAA